MGFKVESSGMPMDNSGKPEASTRRSNTPAIFDFSNSKPLDNSQPQKTDITEIKSSEEYQKKLQSVHKTLESTLNVIGGRATDFFECGGVVFRVTVTLTDVESDGYMGVTNTFNRKSTVEVDP